MRAALFGRLAADDQAMGALAETAIYCQWFHDSEFLSHLHYARWATGEIDIVRLDAATQKPNWCVEVKWSDRPANDSKQLRHVIAFAKEHQLPGNPLDDSAGIRVIVHAPQGPYQSRELSEVDLMEDPEKGWHKIHVLWCRSVEMWRSRLRKTNRDDGRFTYPLFWRNRSEYRPELRDGGRGLLLCGNCSQLLQTLGLKGDVHAFDVCEFLLKRELGSSFNGLNFTADFDLVPNVYAQDWGRISAQFKTMRNWSCERCYVDLSSNPRFLHAHHRDHHKANNSIFNLQALCIKCHAEEHPGNSSLNGAPDLAEFRRLYSRS